MVRHKQGQVYRTDDPVGVAFPEQLRNDGPAIGTHHNHGLPFHEEVRKQFVLHIALQAVVIHHFIMRPQPFHHPPVLLVNIHVIRVPFDPYPFILLNLVLSTLGAIQAPFIIMSQNRKEQKDRERSINDYMVNLKAEIEIRNLHKKVDLLIAEQMNTLFKIQQLQVELMEEIKVQVSAKENCVKESARSN